MPTADPLAALVAAGARATEGKAYPAKDGPPREWTVTTRDAFIAGGLSAADAEFVACAYSARPALAALLAEVAGLRRRVGELEGGSDRAKAALIFLRREYVAIAKEHDVDPKIINAVMVAASIPEPA